MNEQDAIVAQGTFLKTSNLIEQTAYTLELAKKDFDTLAKNGLTQEQLNEAESLKNEIITLKGKQESTKDNIPLATESISDTISEAKDWIKLSKLKAKRAFRLNKTTLDDFMNTPTIGRSVPNTIAALGKLIELQKKYDKELSTKGGGNEFAKEGETLLAELQQLDANQEVAKTNLPQSTRDLYYKQGQLYLILKDINDIAREAFIKNATQSHKYTTAILKRRSAKKEEQPAAAVK